MKKLFKSFFLSFIQMKKSKTTFNKFPKDFYRLLEKEKEELSFRTVTFWEWIPQWGDNIKKVFDFQLRIFLSHITPILKCFAFGTMILMGMSHWQIIIKVYLFRWKWVDHSHKNIIRMRIKICSNRWRKQRDDNRSNGCRGQEVNYLQQLLGLRINPSNRKPQ